MKLAHLILLAGWVLCGSGAMALAGWSSGGGDIQSMHFQKGKIEAVEILKRVLPTSFRDTSDPLQKEAQAFLIKNYAQLSHDVENSLLKWIDRPHAETNKCALTLLGLPAAEVRLSFVNCVGVANAIDAGRVLVHESVHHLDANATEEFADQVAIQAYEAWGNLMLKRIPLCPGANRAITIAPDGHMGDETISRQEAIELEKRGTQVHWRNVSSHLIGAWDWSAAKKMYTKAVFESDHSILEKLPGFGICAYEAGFMTLVGADPKQTKTFPFVLLERYGNASVVYFRERDGNPYGDRESFYMWVLKGVHRIPGLLGADDDLLYVGGDFVYEQFKPLSRIVP